MSHFTRFAIAVLVALTLHAQPRETIEVRLIEVDAVVTDRDGNPLHGLTAADFELFENGKPQTITNFAEYRDTEVAAVSTPQAAAPAPANVAKPAPRTMIFFIDAVPVHGSARDALFDSLRSLVARALRPGDRAQVVRWSDMGGASEATSLTSDRRVIEEAIGTIEKGSGALASGPTAEEYAQFFQSMAAAAGASAIGNLEMTERSHAEFELALMRRKTAAMHRMVANLGRSIGKSVFVYVSEMFPAVAGTRMNVGRRRTGQIEQPSDLALRSGYTTRAFLEQVVDAANASGVAFYTLRPQRRTTAPIDMGTLSTDAQVAAIGGRPVGLEVIADEVVMQNEIDALFFIAEQTGGAMGIGPAAVSEIVERVVRDVSAYYTLAYRAQTDGRDRERSIEVRAKNPDHIVRARKSIVEKSDRTRARDLVLARLFERGPAGDLTFEVKTGDPVPVNKNRVHVPVELAIPSEELQFVQEGGELAAKFTVLSVAGATLLGTGDVTEQTQRITLPAGKPAEGLIRYNFQLLHDRKPTTLVVAVFDENSGQAGTRRISLGAAAPAVEQSSTDAVNDDAWTAAQAIAARDRKPILVFKRPPRCADCAAFEKDALAHPAIARRLDAIVFITQTAHQPGLVLYDHTGIERAKWTGIPRQPAAFGVMLEGIIDAAPNLERAAALFESGPAEGELELAVALSKMGRGNDARKAVARAIANGTPRTQQFGRVAEAMLMVADKKTAEAMQTLDKLIREAISPEVAAMAWLAIGTIHRRGNAIEQAIDAYTTAARIAGPGTEQYTTATQALDELKKVAAVQSGPVRIVPPETQLVTGRHTVRTSVSNAQVARVVFTVDAEQITATRPPFSARIDFGDIPQTKTIRAVAYDAKGNELGRDVLTVNHAGEQFWVRMLEPREGAVSGTVRVSTTMRTPAGRGLKRIVVWWNDAERATITTAPWQADVEIPREAGVLRAVAELDDGRTAEDAVLLNASYTERADVPLVELPITISGRGSASISADDLLIREGKTRRTIESLTSGAEAPLTVGLVLDSSASMVPNLLDVQEAAIRFLETALGARDRAFLITFSTVAQLAQAPTTDRRLLRERIMAIKPNGMTALHDAMVLGLMQFEGVSGRRALIVFSDGADTASRYMPKDVEDLARRSNIPIYLIAARPKGDSGARVRINPMPRSTGPVAAIPNAPPSTTGLLRWSEAYNLLARVSEATGGDAHMIKDLDELPAVYGKIEEALRAQVLALIRTEPGKNENDWRKIDVDVEGRGLRVRAPAGYYAPW